MASLAIIRAKPYTKSDPPTAHYGAGARACFGETSGRVDIAVIGGGSAGIAAALAASRAGRRTLLLERCSAAGGTGGFSGLTTLCGLYDDHGRQLNGGISAEIAQGLAEAKPVRMGRVWVLPYRPARFRELAGSLLTETERLSCRWNTAIADVRVTGADIVSLCGVSVGAVIDCTGSAEVARACGAESLETDEATQAPAIVFPLSNIDCRLDDPAAAARVILPLVRAGLPPLTFQPNLEPGTVTVKFSGKPEQVPEVISFLQSHVEGFEHCLTTVTKLAPSRRAGRMVIGRSLLTGKDVLAGQKHPDAVARCAWPIEQWGPDGMVKMRYLPEGEHYEIPAGCLQAKRPRNLFMAGKTISADVDAIASARVIGCCLATGAAAGNLADKWLRSRAMNGAKPARMNE
jgi:hypothetical protein